MANTLNILLTEEQISWLNSRRKAGGFASTSDVVRDLIRSRQEKEQAELLQRFRHLDGDGSDAAEPTDAVLKIVKRVKKERRGSQSDLLDLRKPRGVSCVTPRAFLSAILRQQLHFRCAHR